MNNLPVDSFFFDIEQREDIQRMAALGYSPKEIAIYLGVDVDSFVKDAYIEGTTINGIIRQGILVSRANPEMKLHEQAEGGNIIAIQQLEKVNRRRTFEIIVEQMNVTKPTRLDLENIDINQITQILSTGDLDTLPPEERAYYELMEMVRGLRARMRYNGKVITKAGIIKLLKSEIYGLSDWMARQVYSDSINFFYAQENIRPEAFANLYAEKLEKWADSMFLMGKGEEASRILERAAKLRLRFASTETEIPEELLNKKQIVIYTTKRSDLGVPETDRKELEEFIDEIPDIPMIVRDRLKEDAQIKKFNLKKRMIEDAEEFREDDTED